MTWLSIGVKSIGAMSIAALWLGAGAVSFAQQPSVSPNPVTLAAPAGPSAPGALSGRLMDVHSAPVGGATVILRNQETGAEMRTTTAQNGGYRFVGLPPGGYTLEAESEKLGRGQVEDIEVASGYESHVQADMEFAAAPAATPARAAVAASSTAPAVPPPQVAIATPRIAAELPTEPLSTELLPIQAVAAKRPSSAVEPRAVAQGSISIPIETPAIAAALPMEAMAAWTHPAPVPAIHAAIGTLALSTLLAAVGARGALASIGPVPIEFGAPQLERASQGQVQAEAAAPPVTTTLTSEQLQALPVIGRRWQELFLDTPTATSASGASQAALRGAGQDPADMTIDGASTRLAFGGSGAGAALQTQDPAGEQSSGQSPSGRGWSGGGFAVAEAAIREVRVVAGNVEAEGAHAAGGRMSVETESGSNQLHGQGFLFDRQNTWGARNPFTTWVKETAPATEIATPAFTPEPFTPPDHEVTWGAGAGSHIRRDKLFWFGALDGYRRNDPGVASAKEPSLFFLQPTNDQAQLLSAQLDLPSVNPVAEGLAAYSGMLEQLAGLLGPAPRTASQWVGFGRIDWQASERNRVTLEATGADWNSPGGGLTRVSETYGNASFGSSRANQELLLARWETFLSPNLLAVTQGSLGRENVQAPPEAPSTLEKTFLAGNAYGQLPQIVVDSRYGFTIGNPARFGQGSYPDERLYHAQQMLDWVHGRLLAKAGFEVDHDVDATTLLRNQTGSYSYSKVQNFIADALVFQKFGANASNPFEPHNCDQTGKPWTTTTGQLMGLGSLPCYSHFSQEIGPNFWQLSTNDWASYVTAQWQLTKWAVFSAGLRWEREQLPPPIKLVENPQLPLTERLPDLGNQWGPRMSLALGNRKRWPVLRLGYGMYYGRVENATVETALSQTGSLNGDLYFFIRPTDGYSSATGTSSAPLFPDVLTGPPGSVVKPGAVEFAPHFRNPEVHQALASVEQMLPGGVALTAGTMISLGRRLPVSIDTNVNTSMSSTVNAGITYNVCDQAPYTAPGANGNGQSNNTNGPCGNLGQGPITTTQITIPYFYASWPGSQATGTCPYYTPAQGDVELGRLCPDYQAISQITSKANSTYEAAMVKLVRYGRRGLSFYAHYTYAHAADWNPEGVTLGPGSDVLDPNPADFSQEYGTSSQDVRHSAAVMAIFQAPWKLHDAAGRFANGWMLSGIGQFHSGLPYSMRITGSLPEEFTSNGVAVTGIGSSLNGYDGDNRYPGLPRNIFRYPDTWKADLRLGKRFDLGERGQLELLAESFNLFNHENVTEIETTGYSIENGSPPSTSGGSSTPPSLNFLTGLYVNPKTGIVSSAFGQPLTINGTNFYRERQIQLGAQFRF